MQTAANADEKMREVRQRGVAALEKGLGYLLKNQAKDGGWHSQAYGQLKGGAALTAFVLEGISHASAEWRTKQRDAVGRGFAFFTPGFTKRGTIACADGSLDHPTYGAALWLLASRRFGREGEDKVRSGLVSYLLGAQCTEDRGFEKESPSFGG